LWLQSQQRQKRLIQKPNWKSVEDRPANEGAVLIFSRSTLDAARRFSVNRSRIPIGTPVANGAPRRISP
jgi:hypothetical protein